MYYPSSMTFYRVHPYRCTFSKMYLGGMDWYVNHHYVRHIKLANRLERGSSNPHPTPICEWLWQGHPAITKST